jgi:dihydrofolate synthase/folylpolyglutamate synthase
LNSATNYERQRPPYTPRAYNLAAMRRILRRAGDPHLKLRVVHVAGTKGKGSVCHMLEALLAARRPGLYTSPHLVDLRERIRIGGRPVSRPELMRAMGRVVPPFRPTFFELMTAAAFEIFARRRVGVAIVEVGLGGRLDCTNVVEPRVCVVNSIDYDHVETLGRTLEKIAGEKAGILKRGVPVVIGPQRPSARRVLLDAARRKNSLVVEVAPPRWRREGSSMRVRWRGIEFSMPFLGPHQAVNAAMALEAAALLGGPCDIEALADLELPGRYQRLGRYILDGAHNAVSVRALARTLRIAGQRDLTLVFGASRDKDARSMLRTLWPLARRVVLTRSSSGRAFEPSVLAALAPRGRKPVAFAATVPEALRGSSGPTLVTGSFYVVGEALAALQ